MAKNSSNTMKTTETPESEKNYMKSEASEKVFAKISG